MARKQIYKKIWEAANGPTPKGWHIHHLDSNSSNNSLENLVCVTRELHSEIHQAMYDRYGLKKDMHAANMLSNYNGCFTSKKCTEETKRKIGFANAGSKNGMYGRKLTYEQIEATIGPKRKIVLDTATGVFYDSAKEAAEMIGMNYGTLKYQLSGRTKKDTTTLIYA